MWHLQLPNLRQQLLLLGPPTNRSVSRPPFVCVVDVRRIVEVHTSYGKYAPTQGKTDALITDELHPRHVAIICASSPRGTAHSPGLDHIAEACGRRTECVGIIDLVSGCCCLKNKKTILYATANMQPPSNYWFATGW
jgi:hypothetical protein